MGNVAMGVFLAAAALLLVAAPPKVRDPAPLVRALRSARLPATATLVRLIAVAEIGVGAAAVLRPGIVTGTLVAAAYLAFTGFVVVALRRGAMLSSCGCFGKTDTPPTIAHLIVTSLLATSGLLVAGSPPQWTAGGTSLWSAASTEPALTAVLFVAAGLVAYLAYLVLAVLPATTAAAVRSAASVSRG